MLLKYFGEKMKKYLFFYLILVKIIFAQNVTDIDKQACRELGISEFKLLELKEKKIYEMSYGDLDLYLDYLDFTQPSLFKRVQTIAKKYIGQPYDLYNMGEFPFELYDSKNLVNLKSSDCVTFVESVMAMALSYDWKSYFIMLQRIRYKNGNIGVAFRNHFSEVDWIPNNSWLARDITDNFDGVNTIKVHSKINKAGFLKRWGVNSPDNYITADWSYIPNEEAPKIIPYLRTGDIVFFVKGFSPSNATITHVGLVSVEEDGVVNLIHSGKPQVQILPLIEYIRKWAPSVEDDVAPALEQEFDEEILINPQLNESEEKSSGGTKECDNKGRKKKIKKGSLKFLGIRVLRLNENPIMNLEKIDGPNAPKLTIYYYK
jgi:hypothetical protein